SRTGVAQVLREAAISMLRPAVVLVGVLLLMLAIGRGGAQAQEVGCVPVEVGEDTGVYFLALGEDCTVAQAEGYIIVAHLARDGDASELLVLMDEVHQDAETEQVAQLLADQVKSGVVDGATWHDAGPMDEASG